ncbi:hypothetical protein HZ326_21458 [Fusarium oxysporum f. sp. albedinis]|nr:hypothetical protein HZ326_21458 [Fusarium oxysporum f. sp. albedinis]
MNHVDRAWKECICNAIFNTYAAEGGIRKRSRSGKEGDIEDIEARQNHLQRDINHVRRGSYSPCLACKGYRQGQPRPFKKRKEKGGYLEPISGNQGCRKTRYGCKSVTPHIKLNCWLVYDTAKHHDGCLDCLAAMTLTPETDQPLGK